MATRSVAELEEALSECEAQRNDAETRMMQAATMGKKLLEDNGGLRQQVALLTQQLADAQALQGLAGDVTPASAHADAAAAAERESALAEAQRQNASLHTQLDDATQANAQLMADVQAKDEQLVRTTHSLRAAEAHAAQVEQLAQLNSELRAQLDAAKRDAAQHSAQHAATAKQWDEQRAKLEARIAESAKVQAAASAASSKEPMLREQLDRLTQELSACKAANEELETQRHQMEEALTGLVLQEKRLRQENQEQLEFIAQARNTIAQLRTNETPAAADAAPSLLAELEGAMDTKIKAQEQRQAAPAPVGGGGDGAPANCEEYFLIAQTAVKIGLAIKFPHQSDAIFKIRGIDLYYKCLNSRVPFHQWHLWISRTLQSMLSGEAKPAAIMKTKKAGGGDGDSGAGGKKGAVGFLSSLFGSGE